jgi:deoxyribodipyrimidine photo-lyase
MPRPTSILWFRNDLRLDDNPALHAALAQGGNVVPLFIWDPGTEGEWPLGGASRCWLHGSLDSLACSLRAAGSRLVIRQGKTLDTLVRLLDETKAVAVFWNRRYEPATIARDKEIKATLRAKGVTAESFNSLLLFEPWAVKTKSSTPYRVFTPFYRACLALPKPDACLPAPEAIARLGQWPDSMEISDLGLLPRIPWDAGIRSNWKFGEAASVSRLNHFLSQSLANYLETRDRPDVDGTSQLSASLHFGEMSPRRAWHTVHEAMRTPGPSEATRCAEGFLRQLVWREFAHHLLFHFPHTPTAPLNQTFERFPWRDNPKALKAWQQGQTGYPVVDAGMRQLWTTGWMHNRVRMVVGSFLVKDLLIPWQRGARWFWDTLIDADLANNTLGWQWVAGCGADAAPFFRIFNPVSQGERFDPNGAYVRQWVPELAKLPDRWIHKPWQAPPLVMQEAGVTLGKSYPSPIVDHEVARKKALELLRNMAT